MCELYRNGIIYPEFSRINTFIDGDLKQLLLLFTLDRLGQEIRLGIDLSNSEEMQYIIEIFFMQGGG